MTTRTPLTVGDTLPVNETFGPTIQGEGPHTGRPVSFVRLGLCDLACSWCDSATTWDRQRYDLDEWNPATPVGDVIDAIHRRAAPITVLSGGEPLIHQQRTAFTRLLAGLATHGPVHVETNGTITPTAGVIGHVAWFTVSPKLANNGADPQHRRIRPAVLDRYAQLARDGRACFKFVAVDQRDLDDVAALVNEIGIRHRDVWIMPEGTSPDGVLHRHRQLAEEITTRGWNTSTRLHTLLWGDERGR